MVRLIFISVVVIHGLLHLTGFAKEWSLGSQEGLSQKNLIDFSWSRSKVAGMFWLFCSIFFTASAILYLMRWESYWLLAGIALLMSQTLIIIYWQDARYGTIINVVILIALIFTAPAMSFEKMVEREIQSLKEHAKPGGIMITENSIARLPSNVRRWMHQSNVVGRENPNIVYVIQKGSMRSKPDGKWMPFEAQQYFSINPPSFVWDAKIKAASFIPIAGRDKYEDGKGNMLIKPLFLFTAANSSGKEIDESTLLRYMAEIAWFPQAAVSNYLKWESINDRQSRVTMSYEGVSASGIYHFNEDGNFAGFEAQRFYDRNGSYSKETWAVSAAGYKIIDNKFLPNSCQVTWRLKEGDFHWLNMEVTAVR